MLKEKIEVAKPINQNRFSFLFPFSSFLIPLLNLVLGSTVIGAFLLDLFGLPVGLGSVGIVVIVAITGFLLWCYKANKNVAKFDSSFILRPLSFIIITLLVLAYLFWLGRPHLLPVGTTVDAVHQYGLAQYINESGRLPIHALEQKPNLQDGLQYPPAFVICAALMSQLLGLNVVYVLYPLAAFFVALALALVFANVAFLLQGKKGGLVLAGLAAGFSLLPYGYTFKSITDQNYFAQAMGQALLLLSLYFLLHWQKAPKRPHVFMFGVTLVTLLITYPTWAFIGFAAFILVALFGVAATIKLRLIYSGVITLLFGIFALLFLKDRLEEGFGTVSNEGLVLLPDLANYTYPLVILAVAGLILTLWRDDKSQKTFALFAGIIFAEGFGFWALKTWFNLGSYYSVYKLLYVGAFILPVFAVLALYYLAMLVKFEPANWFNWLAVPVFVLFLGVIWLIYPQPQRNYPVINRDGVKVAEWIKQNLKVGEYSVAYAVPYGTPAYWIQIGFLKQPRGVRSNNLINNEPVSFGQWFYNPDSEQFLFTDDISKVNLDERLQVLYQSGNSAILTRTAAYKETQQSGTRPNLTIDYKVTLEGNRLNIDSTVTASEEPRKWFSLVMSVEGTDGKKYLNESLQVEETRERKQFLGMVVDLPVMQVREFYLNNQFPKPKGGTALIAGKYAVYLGLQKENSLMERRKVLEFEFSGNKFNSVQPIVLGQFIFEGLITATALPESAGKIIEVSGEKLILHSYSFPAEGKTGENVQFGMNWQVATRIAQNIRIVVGLRDDTGNIVSESEFVPRNGLYPVWLWTPQRLVNLAHGLALPAKPGRYSLAVTLVDADSGQKSQSIFLDKTIVVR